MSFFFVERSHTLEETSGEPWGEVGTGSCDVPFIGSFYRCAVVVHSRSRVPPPSPVSLCHSWYATDFFLRNRLGHLYGGHSGRREAQGGIQKIAEKRPFCVAPVCTCPYLFRRQASLMVSLCPACIVLFCRGELDLSDYFCTKNRRTSFF